MLVLTRKKGEGIVINGNITITVTDIDRGKVKIGIVAPITVPVHRQEIHETFHPKGKKKKP